MAIQKLLSTFSLALVILESLSTDAVGLERGFQKHVASSFVSYDEAPTMQDAKNCGMKVNIDILGGLCLGANTLATKKAKDWMECAKMCKEAWNCKNFSYNSRDTNCYYKNGDGSCEKTKDGYVSGDGRSDFSSCYHPAPHTTDTPASTSTVAPTHSPRPLDPARCGMAVDIDEKGLGCLGMNMLAKTKTDNWKDCAIACKNNPLCRSFVFDGNSGTCYYKNGDRSCAKAAKGFISGPAKSNFADCDSTVKYEDTILQTILDQHCASSNHGVFARKVGDKWGCYHKDEMTNTVPATCVDTCDRPYSCLGVKSASTEDRSGEIQRVLDENKAQTCTDYA